MPKLRVVVRFKGGPGSGHHGHQGRPGKHGGSSPGGGSGSVAVESNDDKRKRMLLSLRTRGVREPLKNEIESILLNNDKISYKHIQTIKQISDEYPYGDKWPSDVHGVAFKDGRLHFNPDTNISKEFLISHELGHLVHGRMSSAAQTRADDAWTIALGASAKELQLAGIVVTGGESGVTTHYALSNVNEFVAESFRIYTYGTRDQIVNLDKYYDGGLSNAFDI